MFKKITFLSLLLSVLFIKNTNALSLTQDNILNDYYFEINNPLKSITLTKEFKRFQVDKKYYYDISPSISFFEDQDDYIERKTELSNSKLEEISKIIYYGYGYTKHTDIKYYYATQYLIYKTFSDIEVRVLKDNEESDYLAKEIEDIKSLIDKDSFNLKDLETSTNNYTITNKYIIDNFNIEGENILVNKSKNKIVIDLLNNLDNYEIKFIPKNSINDVVSLVSNTNNEFINMDSICEKEKKINIKYLKVEEEIEDDQEVKIDEVIKEEDNEEDNEEIEEEEEEEDVEVTEVLVPSTSKNDFPIFLVIIMLGGSYYVFKTKYFNS